MLQRLAAFEPFDLLGDMPEEGCDVRGGRSVRRDENRVHGPERAFERQRFLFEDVERGAAQRAVDEAGDDIRLYLAAPAAGIDEDRRPKWPVAAARQRPQIRSPALSGLA